MLSKNSESLKLDHGSIPYIREDTLYITQPLVNETTDNLLFSPSMTTAAGSCRDRELAENISLGYGGSQLVLSP